MSSERDFNEIITLLDLEPHPEGGFYRETYRDVDCSEKGRSCSTMIYFLLTADNPSHLHLIDAAESWHFYAGDAIEVIELSDKGPVITQLGSHFADGQRPQHVVAKDRWFGSRILEGGKWALVGCVVAPGFSFDAFEIGQKETLLQQFPQCHDVIHSLVREN